MRGREFEEAVADKGYDSDELVQYIRDEGAKAVIPPRSNRLHKRRWNKQAYKQAFRWWGIGTAKWP